VGEEAYFVEIEWSRWTNAGKVNVNGKIIKEWTDGWALPEILTFRIGDEKLILLRKGFFFWENWVLIARGKKLE